MDAIKRILSINAVWAVDETPDLSHLETTADYHYGRDGANWAHVSPEERAKVVEQYGSIMAACEEYARQDAERLARYHAGDWLMQGCWAQAQVVVDGTIQRIKSGGLWGIESDSDEGYRRDVEEGEKAELLGILSALGFDTAEETTRLLDSLLAQVTQE